MSEVSSETRCGTGGGPSTIVGAGSDAPSGLVAHRCASTKWPPRTRAGEAHREPGAQFLESTAHSVRDPLVPKPGRATTPVTTPENSAKLGGCFLDPSFPSLVSLRVSSRFADGSSRR